MPSRDASSGPARVRRVRGLILALLLLSLLPGRSVFAAPVESPSRGVQSPAFTDLIYGTYLGGTGYESYPSIAVDAAGNAYIAASTFSKDFPGFVYGSRSSEMATVASISPDGRRLNYVGMISGALGTQIAQAIAVTPDGTAYITGVTNAKDFPVTAGNGGTACGRNNDVFLVILDPSGGLRFSGCWGGTGWDQPLDIALTADGDVVIAGYTHSSDFPTTTSAFQAAYAGSYDGFLLRLHRDAPKAGFSPWPMVVESGSRTRSGGEHAGALADASGSEAAAGGAETWSVVAGSYLGGYGDDRAYDVDVDAGGSVLVSGQAGDAFPVTPGAFQTTRAEPVSADAFVAHLSADLTTALFSTYIGGPDKDYAKAATFAPDGIVVTGLAQSELPVTEGAYDATGDAVDGDVFVAKLDASGSRLLRSTYLGLSGQDEPSSLLVDGAGYVTLSGVSQFAFPTTPGSFDPTYNGLSETWISRLDPELRRLTYSTVVGGSGHDGLRSFQGNALRAPVARLPGDPAAPGHFSPDDSFYLATITFSRDWPISGTSFQSKLNYQWDLGITRLRLAELRAVHTETSVAIDGVFTGWRTIPGLFLNSRNAGAMVLRPPSGNAAPVPPSLADASGRLQLQWDEAALYVAVTISDNDALVPVGFPAGPAPGEPSGGDAVELTVEVRGKSQRFVYPSAATAGDSGLVRVPAGWALEAAIRAEALGLAAGSLGPGDVVEITWTIVDADAGQPEQSLTVTVRTRL